MLFLSYWKSFLFLLNFNKTLFRPLIFSLLLDLKFINNHLCLDSSAKNEFNKSYFVYFVFFISLESTTPEYHSIKGSLVDQLVASLHHSKKVNFLWIMNKKKLIAKIARLDYFLRRRCLRRGFVVLECMKDWIEAPFLVQIL